VIDSGGIFVATYQIPEIESERRGQGVDARGYEFEALGIVRWTREAPMSGSDSPPASARSSRRFRRKGDTRLPLRAQPRTALPRRSVKE